MSDLTGYRVRVLAPDGTAIADLPLDEGERDVTTASGRAFLSRDVETAVDLHRRRIVRQARADVVDGRGVST